MKYGNKFIENIALFFEGALDFKGKSVAHLEYDAREEMDQFLLLCFGDLLGIETPLNYYALEMLPYLVDELDGWQLRMQEKKSVWESKGAGMDMDP